MTTYTAAQIEPLAQRMVEQLPGLDIRLARVWIKSESGVGNNPLGVTSVQGGVSKLNTYSSPLVGIDAAIALIKSSDFYAGIRNAIKGGNIAEQARAIIASPWHSRNSPYYTKVFTSAGFLGVTSTTTPSSPSPIPSGGASTPITPLPTTTIPSATLPFINIQEGKILDANDVTYIIEKFRPLLDKYPDIAVDVAEARIRKILENSIGQPWTKDVRNRLQEALRKEAEEAGNPLGINLDIPAALMFIGVILIGITFIGVGGIITLRKSK